MVHCTVYEAATNTKVAEEALQFTGPSGIPEDGSRGYFGFFVNPQGNAFTVMPVDFERTYAVNVVNGDFSTQVSAEYGKNYDLSEYVAQRDGYEFKGWEYVKDGKTEIISSAGVWKTDFTTQSGGVYTGTLTAKYVPVEYNIVYVIEGGSNAAENPASINVEDGVVEDVLDALVAFEPRELEELGERGHELGAVGEVVLLVELGAVLGAPVTVGVGEIVLAAINIHKNTRLGAQVVHELVVVERYRLLNLESHDGAPFSWRPAL